MLHEWWFWAFGLPLFALWTWWDKRAEKRRGRPFTPREQVFRDAKVKLAALAVLAAFGVVMWVVRG